MVMLMNSCTFPEALDRVGEYLRVGTAIAPEPRQRPQEARKEIPSTFAYAVSIWGPARRDDDYVASHPYCQRKGIKHAAGAGRARVSGKLIGQDADCIVVPLRDLFTEQLVGVECINAEGKKQTFGSKGVVILGNDLDPRIPTRIFEGWATTAVTVFGDAFFKGNACGIVAGGKARLMKVAADAVKKYDREVLVWAEEDGDG
jgi:putative DNA primase/helicase